MKLATATAAGFLLTFPALAEPVLEVTKTPTCGCCAAWVEHMRAAGFEVRATDVTQSLLAATKARLGITPELSSCHTARIDGYVVEGHVPAEDLARLLAERPGARGLAVPGMPLGSPGMEAGAVRDRFDVLLVGRDGEVSIFTTHGAD